MHLFKATTRQTTREPRHLADTPEKRRINKEWREGYRDGLDGYPCSDIAHREYKSGHACGVEDKAFIDAAPVKFIHS